MRFQLEIPTLGWESNDAIAMRIVGMGLQTEIPNAKPAVVIAPSILCRKDVNFGCPGQALLSVCRSKWSEPPLLRIEGWGKNE